MVKKTKNYSPKSLQLPRSVAWKQDIDYLYKLAPEERAWLMSFLNGYYRASFHEGDDWTPEERRAAYRMKNESSRDLYPRDVDSFGDTFEHIVGSDDDSGDES